MIMEFTNKQIGKIKEEYRKLVDDYDGMQQPLEWGLSVYYDLDDTYRLYGCVEVDDETEYIVIQIEKVTEDNISSLVVFETEKMSIKQMNDCIDKAIQYYYSFVNQNSR